MKVLNTWLAILVAALACLLTTVGCRAWDDAFDTDSEFASVVVTGNYVDSRLLAELIQDAREHPIVLLPTGEEKTMYLLGSQGAAVEVSDDDLEWLMDQLQPKTIIFLGDDGYAPMKYQDRLKDKFACARFANGDWDNIARSVGELLEISNLAKDYRQLRAQLNQRGRLQPTKEFDELFARDRTNPDILAEVREEVRQREAAKKAQATPAAPTEPTEPKTENSGVY